MRSPQHMVVLDPRATALAARVAAHEGRTLSNMLAHLVCEALRARGHRIPDPPDRRGRPKGAKSRRK